MSSIDKYLNDPKFCSWALGEAEETVFWNKYISDHPEEKEIIEKAVSIVQKVKVDEPTITDAHVQKLWSSIAQQTVQQTKSRSLFPQWSYAVAASIALLITVSVVYFQFFQGVQVQAEYAEQKTHVLPDGSEVWINAGSKIKYDPEKWAETRTLQLEGEAYFEVEKGSKFTVQTPKGDVSVLGTRFNVFARSDDFRVECYSGKVKVESPNQKEVILEQGDKAVLAETLLKKEETTTSRIPLWKEGHFQFDNMLLTDVFDEVERQFDVSINFKDQTAIQNRRYTGTFSNKNLEICLEIVCVPMGLKYTVNGQEITIE
ncbi:FecR family protein [Sediminitomix flava]|uniref:FecR family protein n=1 Tax=Sediminitomix flava TaxID=379075 RepID=A0A315ZC77_SEDFL|nr:FecR domain-containing protein [Sediminitomix flava]PWJ43141.1 FecR family protein [Sediminitomix flava]